jgi:tetratricopeptide (TPR) repeat protein
MRINLKTAILCMIISCVVLIMPAFAGVDDLKDANRFYKENKYDQAVEAYEKLVTSGFESGALYYNLGNSYFKKGELGRALLNYERAKLFIPHDSDLRSNYDFVRGALNVSAQYNSEIFIWRWLDRLFDGVGMNGLAMLVSVLWISILVLMSAVLFMPVLKQYAAPLAVILAVFLIICSTALVRKIGYYERGAIVVASEVEAKFEPGNSATTFFKLTEGNSVLVLDRSSDWVKILRPDSKIGWVPASSIEGIRE